MNIPPLFYHADLAHSTAQTYITGSEAVHISRARRLGNGDEVHLTDGVGNLARGQIAQIDERPLRVQVSIQHRQYIAPPPVEIVLAAALPKGEHQSVMLDMATQLGMNRFIPLHCERSVVRLQPRMHERWLRIIHSASKQCRQCNFPTIDAATDLAELLERGDDDSDRLVLVGAHDGIGISQLNHQQSLSQVLLLIGPEGGFSPSELTRLARRAAFNIALGAQILRTETAAVALLAATNQMLTGYHVG